MRLPRGKVLLTLAALAALTACATIGPPQPPSLELPKPPTDLRAVRKGDKVLLSWTRPAVTTDRQTLRGPVPVLICRTIEATMSECGTPVGRFTGGAMLAASPSAIRKQIRLSEKKSAEARITDSYTDVLGNQILSAEAQANRFATFAVEALNENGRSAGLSNKVRVLLARTLPPPQDLAAKVSAPGVVLTWTGELLPRKTEGIHYVYRVYRSTEGSKQQVQVGELSPGEEQPMTLIDSNIEWEKTYFYRAEALTIIDQPETQIEGDDTAEVKVFAHDVFPPAVPVALQAVFSGPGQAPFIDLIWAPVTDADLAGYNVYRHEGNDEPVRVNAEPGKVPAYRDAKVASGKTYFYSVSSVDVRGNESACSAEASESVPAK
jgi:hypothetical protein